jgi:hypothetical protein
LQQLRWHQEQLAVISSPEYQKSQIRFLRYTF